MIESKHDAFRQRFAQNINCWFKENGCPELPIFLLDSDRSIHNANNDFVIWADKNMDKWNHAIDAHQPFGYSTALLGWRERRWRYSCQAILHRTNEINYYIEFDFDANNPNWGALPALLHGLNDWLYQKLSSKKTDPFKVAQSRGWLNA